MRIGDNLICVFNQPLPGRSCAPELKLLNCYTVQDIFIDSKGNSHIDVGLPLKINYVTSYATNEMLPDKTHWCHPNRFILMP